MLYLTPLLFDCVSIKKETGMMDTFKQNFKEFPIIIYVFIFGRNKIY